MSTPSAPYTHQKGKILSQKDVAQNYREMTVQWTVPALLPSPGQFFMLLPQNWPMPILRRPFAYSDANETAFSFIYEIRGSVTTELARLKTGDSIDWIGPLGTGFPYQPLNNRPVLVSGGVGVGPIYFLANYFKSLKENPLLILGARTRKTVADLNWPKGMNVHICSDDGSAGIKGTVMEALQTLSPGKSVFYSCGPWPMLKAVHSFAVERESPSWVSVEEIMACGIGNCQSCAVPYVSGHKHTQYKRACVEGPVFNSRDLIWT